MYNFSHSFSNYNRIQKTSFDSERMLLSFPLKKEREREASCAQAALKNGPEDECNSLLTWLYILMSCVTLYPSC